MEAIASMSRAIHCLGALWNVPVEIWIENDSVILGEGRTYHWNSGKIMKFAHLILHRDSGGSCLYAPWWLHWLVPLKCSVEIYNFLIGCYQGGNAFVPLPFQKGSIRAWSPHGGTDSNIPRNLIVIVGVSQAWNYTQATEAMASVVLAEALVPLQRLP